MRIVVGVAAATSVVVSLVAVLLLGERDRGQSITPTTAQPTRGPTERGSELAGLRDSLERERTARLALARRVEGLREALEKASSATARTLESDTRRTVTSSHPAEASDLESDFAELWFSEQALRDEGLSATEVQRLRRRFDEVELEKLYARDRALREGWSSSSRHYAELRDIRREFRDEVGDDDYDRVLYASGRKNRVRVLDLLRGSAAEDSGIEVGDVVYRYAGERVFDPSTLYIQTTQGRLGESVEIEVLRDDEIIALTIPRGPLGGKMLHFSVPPGS